MATGSGKTLVIVKLLEMLGYLIKQKEIPDNDILFLTYREDLIDQFKNHIDEFNKTFGYKIYLYDLKDYAKVKHDNKLRFGNEIDVFYYRSDLISDEQKDKIVDFKNYDNNGKWYILLDEAHKGDREDSKRQFFYSILSRNGFLFNFSATFTDNIDYATCVYNFNLARFIEEGYGKHIYISKENINALGNKKSNIETEKQKILLKIFVLQTIINNHYNKIQQIKKHLYHKPLLLTLVNSVNTEDSDLELFFKEIEKIANGNLDDAILNQAKEELKSEITSKDIKYEFEDQQLNQDIISEIDNITYQSILEAVFNSKTNGIIEILKIPSNKQELVFKLKTSDKPFALMKIGDISEWIKNKLTGYEIIERFENESIFKQLNKSDEINILMGSRSFYEGWDSNRPNIILYINIGKGIDARKFVLQSIGRGVRIEPIPNQRKRLQYLYNNNEIDNLLYDNVKTKINALETLFVFGTKADNLIPKYKNSDTIIAEETNIIKFPIHPEDFELVKKYYSFLGDKIVLCKYDCDIRVLKKFKEIFGDKQKDNYFIFDNNYNRINNPDILLNSIFNHFSNKVKEFEDFKKLENEIIHFKRITITKDKLDDIRKNIEKVKNSRDEDKRKNELKIKYENKEISLDEYTKRIEEIARNLCKEAEITYNQNDKIKIKLLTNHYYIPILLSENEKLNFLKHIVKNKSEIEFLNELEKYLKREDNFFKNFDWWYFSKIDETLDEVYIPYYQPKTNRIEKFKPDFIFWLKKGNEYTILFIDPKGTEHTDALRKIDGYTRIFEEGDRKKKKAKIFSYDNDNYKFNVKIKLFLWTKEGTASGTEGYQDYWIDKFDNNLFN
jgi:superfamily II DNA or RNA helicase